MMAGKIGKLLGLRPAAGAALVACAVVLSACGGTTYGTGVTQESQTLKDLYGMLSLQQKRATIDYSARPDLIVPQNTAALPAPLDSSTTTSDPQWPETPEERLARIRAQSGEVDSRSGDYSVADLNRKKEAIGIDNSYQANKFVPGQTDRDGNVVSYNGKSQAREEVLKARAAQDYSRGAKRKYLTEPPVEYRVAAETAPAGEEAFTEEELIAREKAGEAKPEFKVLKPLDARD